MYMKIPGTGMHQDPQTFLTFDLDVASGGTFSVWLLGTGRDSASDSFFVQIDGATPVRAVVTQGHWGWKKISSTLMIGNGAHSLTVKNREDGASVDKILLTRDNNYTPTGLGGAALTPGCG
jgi:hypothetical protein